MATNDDDGQWQRRREEEEEKIGSVAFNRVSADSKSLLCSGRGGSAKQPPSPKRASRPPVGCRRAYGRSRAVRPGTRAPPITVWSLP